MKCLSLDMLLSPEYGTLVWIFLSCLLRLPILQGEKGGWSIIVVKFGTGIDLDELSDEFDGQGHRSKVKVIKLKNIIFEFWPGFSML